ncbi:alkaline phosphatase family protein [Paenibacillaceae bacterium]|nr:alkaline phosphatase family protein [Paenibacillaceae bacterium]
MLNKGIRILVAILILVAISGCHHPKPVEQDLMHLKSDNNGKKKKVILLLIDSLMAQSIDEGIRQQELPAFQFLIEHGQYYKDLVSSFPTMSVTIDSSLLTGKYPDVHHVPGLTWYSADDKKLINYGTGPMEVLRHGLHPVLTDALIHLNGSHLNGKLPTIYEDLARHGLKSGSINGLIYRGTFDHLLTIPAYMQGPASLAREIQVKGPDFLTLGALSNPLAGVKNLPESLMDKMGFNNDYAIETAKYLIETNNLPDFLLVYLPDLDQQLHKKGPAELKGVKVTDQQLQSLLQSFGSPEKALNDAIIMVVGDSGMTPILPADQNPIIDLSALFGDARVLRPGEAVTKETEIILAVNETMAYVYSLKAARSLRDTANVLINEPRIDLIAWKEKEWMYVIQGPNAKPFRFKANGNLTDPYQQSWEIEQEQEMLDINLNAAARSLNYGEYPDVLQRLSGALNSHKGNYLVVTAKPGYELVDRSSPTHKGGGGHGSIRKKESLVPLIIGGTDQKPQHLRMIDLKPYLLDLLTDIPQSK